MKRGRPRLHHTPEQRADAHRAASARHHERYKNNINQKRQSKYQQSAEVPYKPVTGLSLVQQIAQQRILTGGDYWAERVDRHTVKWRLFLGGSCTDILERVAQGYLRNMGNESAKKEAASRNKIQQEIDSTTLFLNRFRSYEGEILQADGVGQKLARANLISTEVGRVVWCLEDLLCQAMAGRISFESKYTAGQLMYQLK